MLTLKRCRLINCLRALIFLQILLCFVGCSSKTNDPGPLKTNAEILNGKWVVTEQRYGEDANNLASVPLTTTISVIFTLTGGNAGTYTYDEVSNSAAAILAIDNGTWRLINDINLVITSTVNYENATNKVVTITSNSFVLLFPAQTYSYFDAAGKLSSATYKELVFKRIN